MTRFRGENCQLAGPLNILYSGMLRWDLNCRVQRVGPVMVLIYMFCWGQCKARRLLL